MFLCLIPIGRVFQLFMNKNKYPKSGPIRGLIKAAKNNDINDKYRALYSNASWLPRKFGTCRWCGQPIGHKRALWHDDCFSAYSIGTTNNSYIVLYFREEYKKNKDDRHSNCEECGKKFGFKLYKEWDHRVALSIARERRRLGYRDWWKAWHVSNLRALCHDCHSEKTRQDRLELKKIRKEVKDGKKVQSLE